LAERRQLDLLLRHFFPEEPVGNLNEDACAIGSFGVRTHRAAMGQIAQNLQSLLDNGVTLAALDMRDKAYSARIVLVGGIVKSLRAWRTEMVHHAESSR
jgi:hypothetical protein